MRLRQKIVLGKRTQRNVLHSELASEEILNYFILNKVSVNFINKYFVFLLSFPGVCLIWFGLSGLLLGVALELVVYLFYAAIVLYTFVKAMTKVEVKPKVTKCKVTYVGDVWSSVGNKITIKGETDTSDAVFAWVTKVWSDNSDAIYILSSNGKSLPTGNEYARLKRSSAFHSETVIEGYKIDYTEYTKQNIKCSKFLNSINSSIIVPTKIYSEAVHTSIDSSILNRGLSTKLATHMETIQDNEQNSFYTILDSLSKEVCLEGGEN